MVVVSYCQGRPCLVLVNRLEGLSLPRNSTAIIWPARHDLVVDWAIKPQHKQTNKIDYVKIFLFSGLQQWHDNVAVTFLYAIWPPLWKTSHEQAVSSSYFFMLSIRCFQVSICSCNAVFVDTLPLKHSIVCSKFYKATEKRSSWTAHAK